MTPIGDNWQVIIDLMKNMQAASNEERSKILEILKTVTQQQPASVRLLFPGEKKATTQKKSYFTSQEAAAHMRIHVRTLRRLVKRGEIRPIVMLGKHLFLASQLDSYLHSLTQDKSL